MCPCHLETAPENGHNCTVAANVHCTTSSKSSTVALLNAIFFNFTRRYRFHLRRHQKRVHFFAYISLFWERESQSYHYHHILKKTSSPATQSKKPTKEVSIMIFRKEIPFQRIFLTFTFSLFLQLIVLENVSQHSSSLVSAASFKVFPDDDHHQQQPKKPTKNEGKREDSSAYRIGLGIGDVTGPAAEINMVCEKKQ